MTVKANVWAASLVGPVLMPVRKFAFVTKPASSANNTRFVLMVKAG